MTAQETLINAISNAVEEMSGIPCELARKQHQERQALREELHNAGVRDEAEWKYREAELTVKHAGERLAAQRASTARAKRELTQAKRKLARRRVDTW